VLTIKSENEEFREEKVAHENEDTGGHDYPRGRVSDAFGAAFGVKSLPTRSNRDEERENDRLQHPRKKVGGLYSFERLRDEKTLTDPELELADDHRAPERDIVGEEGEQWQRDHARENPRNHDALNRARAERADRVDLLGDFHRRDFGRDPRADSTGDEERSKNRTHLAKNRKRRDFRNVKRATEFREPETELECHHRTGREAGDRDEKEGIYADEINLVEYKPKIERRTDEIADNIAQEMRESTGELDQRISRI
jgi:hypothetical protein